MVIKTCSNLSEFTQLLSTEAPTRLIVVDFTAKWCGPCKMIAPLYEEMSNKFPHVKFLKVDVDDAQEIASRENVTSMPTFKLYKQGNMIEELVGANIKGLEQLVVQHQGPNDDRASALGISGHSDISSLINKGQIESLNIDTDRPIADIFKPTNKTPFESDCDEQIIINFEFLQAVRLHSIQFQAPLESAPRRIKLFANIKTLGFDDATSMPATQELELTEADFAENAVTNLNFVKFQNLKSLVIFVEDNLGEEDVTKLTSLTLIGSAVQTTNMKEFNK